MSDAIATQRLRVESTALQTEAIQLAATAIREGKLVAFPTETVYGLGANAFNTTAIARIFAAKGRPSSNPLIVHLATVDHLATVATEIPDLAQRLLTQFAPGPLTLVLPRHPRVPAIVSAGLSTIAVRIPHHPVAHALLVASNVPIAAPSANRSNYPSPTTADHVVDDLWGRIDIVLDGGPTPIGIESTVVDLTTDVPRLLRPGSISLEQLLTIVPSLDLTLHRAANSDTAPTASPGMSLKHYAPQAQVLLFQGDRPAVLAHMQARASDLVQAGQRLGLLVTDEDADQFAFLVSQPTVMMSRLGTNKDIATIAHRLFAALRELDHWGADLILMRAVDPHGLGLAIYDRLFRAAAGQIIQCD